MTREQFFEVIQRNRFSGCENLVYKKLGFNMFVNDQRETTQ